MTALLLLTALAAEPDGDQLVRVTAEAQPLQGAQPFWVALRYQVEPGWHIYWENPGQSGLKTDAAITAPPGWTVGPLVYPTPERFDLPGGIVNYGYEGEVALLFQVTPPRGVKGRDAPQLGIETDWLVCREACLRGAATLALRVGIKRPGAPLSEALARLPVDLSSLPGATQGWQDRATWRATLPGVTAAQLFPSVDLESALAGLETSPDPRGLTISLSLDPAAIHPDADLRAVIRLEGPSVPEGVRVALPPPPGGSTPHDGGP